MKRGDMPQVLCEYADAETELPALLEEAFRLYLTRSLDAEGMKAHVCKE